MQKLLLVLVASTSVAYGANVGCRAGVTSVLKPDTKSLTLNYSPNLLDKANQCKVGIQKKRPDLKVNLTEMPNTKDQFEVATP